MKARHVPWLAVLVFLLQAPLYAGYITDDSYIYARFADNLARHGELSFNLGEPVHAATSPLWAALGAIGTWTGIGSIEFLRALGIFCGALGVFLLARTAARLLAGRPVVVAVVGLVLATEPWLVRWSSSGMETALGVLLLAIALEATLRPVDRVAWRRGAAALGFLPLVRPEALLLIALFGLHVLRTPGARRRLDVYLLAATPMLAWASVAIPLYGHVLPETMRAKSTPLGLQPDRLLYNVRVMAQILAIGAAVPVLVWAWRLVRQPQRLVRVDDDQWGSAAWWQWTLLLPVVYVVRDVQVVSRYVELVLPAMVLLAATTLSLRPSRPVRLAFAAQAALALALTMAWIAPSARAFGTSLVGGLGDIASWLRTETPADATVAIYDIGVLGRESERRILDLGGLVHPGINALRDRLDDATILHEGLFLDFGRPDYLVDRDVDGAVLDGRTIRDVRLRAILSREVANLGLSRGRPVVYTLYAVEDGESAESVEAMGNDAP